LAAPSMVPVTMTARTTSTWRRVIICPSPRFPRGAASNHARRYYHAGADRRPVPSR
jgi:hypothetical protein